MRKVVPVACAMLLATAVATAAEPPDRGFYVGGSVGVGSFDDDGAFSSDSFDDSDTAFTIFGGYKILKYLAVEGRLSSLGSYSVNSTDLDVTGYSLHAVGILPFGQSGWELFGQLGIGSVNIDVGGFGDEDNTVGSAGLGVRFYPTPHLAISLQTDAYAWEEEDFLDRNYDLAVGATQLGVHYIF